MNIQLEPIKFCEEKTILSRLGWDATLIEKIYDVLKRRKVEEFKYLVAPRLRNPQFGSALGIFSSLSKQR